MFKDDYDVGNSEDNDNDNDEDVYLLSMKPNLYTFGVILGKSFYNQKIFWETMYVSFAQKWNFLIRNLWH